MKNLLTIVFILLFFQLSSCDFNKFAAGSYPYAERTEIGCSSDVAVRELQALKSSGDYDHPHSFPDGVSGQNNDRFNFYFYLK